MAWNENLPEWNAAGTEPDQTKKDNGWQIEEKPPAGFFNWLFNRIYNCLQEIRSVFDTHEAGPDPHSQYALDTDLDTLAGAGHTTETVKGNADAHAAHLADDVTDAHGLDYEEGTFTPDLRFGGNNTGITYDRQTGRYTRVGRKVFFELEIRLTNKGTATGAATIEGLPFVVLSGLPTYSTQNAGFSNCDLDLTSPEKNIIVRTVGELSTIYFNIERTNAGFLSFTDARFANDSWVSISGTYIV